MQLQFATGATDGIHIHQYFVRCRRNGVICGVSAVQRKNKTFRENYFPVLPFGNDFGNFFLRIIFTRKHQSAYTRQQNKIR